MKDLISIIVPVYNDEKYLCRCLNSILLQTYENLEIILVLDGSTDNSFNICEKYKDKDKRIVIYKKRNGGTADSRNFGLDRVKGEYISFMDSDDYIDPQHIRIMYEGIEKTGAQISATGLQEIEEQDLFKRGLEYFNDYEVLNKEDAFRNLFNDNKFGNFVWNKLFRKDLFNDTRFPVIPKIEDMGIMYLLFDKVDYICFNKTQSYYWVQRNNSQLHTHDFVRYRNLYDLIKKRFYFINDRFPEMAENNLYFARIILECYPYFINNKELRDSARREMNDLYDNVKDKLNLKDKIKIRLFGMRI